MCPGALCILCLRQHPASCIAIRTVGWSRQVSEQALRLELNVCDVFGTDRNSRTQLAAAAPHSCQSELPEPECDFKQTKFYEDHIARSEPIGMATFEVRSELVDDFC